MGDQDELVKEADRTLATFAAWSDQWPSKSQLRDLIERLAFALLSARNEQREQDAAKIIWLTSDDRDGSEPECEPLEDAYNRGVRTVRERLTTFGAALAAAIRSAKTAPDEPVNTNT